jgi:hypothetical protein
VLRDVKLAYNGLTPFPARAKKIEAVLEGRRPEDLSADALDDAIAQASPPATACGPPGPTARWWRATWCCASCSPNCRRKGPEP